MNNKEILSELEDIYDNGSEDLFKMKDSEYLEKYFNSLDEKSKYFIARYIISEKSFAENLFARYIYQLYIYILEYDIFEDKRDYFHWERIEELIMQIKHFIICTDNELYSFREYIIEKQESIFDDAMAAISISMHHQNINIEDVDFSKRYDIFNIINTGGEEWQIPIS